MKKVYVIQYVEVDDFAYEYTEHTRIEDSAFKSYREASIYLLNNSYFPYSAKNGYGKTMDQIDWCNEYQEWAEIYELEIVE